MNITSSQATLLITALGIAVEQFKLDRDVATKARDFRVAEQFERQIIESRELIDELNTI